VNPLPDGGLLTKLLQIFVFNFAGGASRLTPDAQWLLVAFYGIDLMSTGIWFALRRELDMWHLFTRALTAVIVGWLITNWVPITKALMQGFLGAGIKAGGDALTELDFTNPDRILLHGFGVTAVVFKMIADTSAWSLKTQVLNLLAGLVTLGTMCVYIVLAVCVFLALVEFYWSLPITLIMLPFSMLPRAHWLAERGIAHTFAGAIRIGGLALSVSATLPLMVLATWASADSLAVAFYALTIAAALAGMAWKVNTWARAVLNGSVAFGPQDVTTQIRSMTTQITHLGMVMQTMLDVMARTDPTHDSRQPTASRRRP
jgi:TrbL/VirB6 plasmid conjugal transfer protein